MGLDCPNPELLRNERYQYCHVATIMTRMNPVKCVQAQSKGAVIDWIFYSAKFNHQTHDRNKAKNNENNRNPAGKVEKLPSYPRENWLFRHLSQTIG
jgi:hypothetical protein